MHAAEARRDRRNAYAACELIGPLGGAFELEAQHAAEAREQTPRPLVPRMALEPRVVHAGHGAVRLEKLREPECAGVLVAHAQREGLEPAVEQERGVRVE